MLLLLLVCLLCIILYNTYYEIASIGVTGFQRGEPAHKNVFFSGWWVPEKCTFHGHTHFKKTFPIFLCQHNISLNQLSQMVYVPLPLWLEQGEWRFPTTRRRKILCRREPAYWCEMKLFHRFQWHFCHLKKQEIWPWDPSAIWKQLHSSQLPVVLWEEDDPLSFMSATNYWVKQAFCHF